MISKLYDSEDKLYCIFEATHIQKNIIGGFLVWEIYFEDKRKITLREGDKARILTTTGQHLKTITQSNSKGV